MHHLTQLHAIVGLITQPRDKRCQVGVGLRVECVAARAIVAACVARVACVACVACVAYLADTAVAAAAAVAIAALGRRVAALWAASRCQRRCWLNVAGLGFLSGLACRSAATANGQAVCQCIIKAQERRGQLCSAACKNREREMIIMAVFRKDNCKI